MKFTIKYSLIVYQYMTAFTARGHSKKRVNYWNEEITGEITCEITA